MLPKLAKQSGFQAWKLAGLANARRRCARRETCAHILNAHMRAKKNARSQSQQVAATMHNPAPHHEAILTNYADKACKAIKIAIVGFQAWKLRAHVRAHTGRAAIPAHMLVHELICLGRTPHMFEENHHFHGVCLPEKPQGATVFTCFKF